MVSTYIFLLLHSHSTGYLQREPHFFQLRSKSPSKAQRETSMAVIRLINNLRDDMVGDAACTSGEIAWATTRVLTTRQTLIE